MDRPDLEAINEWNRGREGPESWIRRDAQDAAQYAFALERELQADVAECLTQIREARDQRNKAQFERDAALAKLQALREAVVEYEDYIGLYCDCAAIHDDNCPNARLRAVLAGGSGEGDDG